MMKLTTICSLALLSLLPLTPCASAADAKAELQELIGKVKAKLAAGEKTEAALADELKTFDQLLTEHRGEKTDDVAQILFMKAVLFAEVFEDEAKAAALMKETHDQFPETGPGRKAPEMAAMLEAQGTSKAIQKTLVPGALFPDFSETSVDGKPLSVSQHKGKVLLVDFWATWCGPCVAELPNVIDAYGKFHAQGFDIIGISLDEEKEKLTAFTAEQKMTWPQYFDGKGWQSKLATKYGVTGIPATYLLDKEGKIIGAGLRGEELQAAIAKAVQ